MTRKERFYATIERKSVDRPASWLGEPVPAAVPGLMNYFDAKDEFELKNAIHDDVFSVNVPYSSEHSSHITTAFQFAKVASDGTPDKRTLTAPGFFEDYHNPSDVDKFPWPDPSKHIDPAACKAVVDAAPQDVAVMGMMWSAHFQDACSAYGMEKALMGMMLEPQLFDAVIDRITEFYLQGNEIFYQAAKHRLDAVLIGNDFGSQTGLMLSPELLRKHVFRGTKKLIDQAHSYGFKVIHHSCGAIRDIIPDLIDLGVDAVHPIQALATGMEPEKLAKDFGKNVSFCGGVDAQNLLVNGSPKDIEETVKRLMGIFPTGLIISPSHEAILPDVDPANVEALFRTLQNA
ncbi:MAG: hypothetical protein JJE08_06260 [Proteiniphilum sp.]|nr:hypothetical protein [Proteiniphilum sp.]